uniref:HSF-type DNA-binding domain-containing protein n=1 Tax=Peronospora matthiolae TaxID=2874970 RepID=A0AAV1UIC7_9STRA
MAKRVRVGNQDAGKLTPAGPSDVDKMAPVSAPLDAPVKSKAAAIAHSEGKHVMLPAFLSKTYEIFSMPEFAHVCGWNATGDTIIVAQLETFVAMVLPRFFKHRNFPSFVRQLNLYGFHKTVLDSKRLEFQHPYFKRGRPDLLHLIKRKVSSSSSSSSSHHNQHIVSTSIQNSRLDAHREISDTLLREMKELRQRGDAMEKRLREVEIDNAIVRSDNVKLWKHLEAAKDKQLVMQEKMKKIMWILFQIYRGKQQNLPQLSSNDATGAFISEDYTNGSMLGPKEFRDVLRFLAMDEPPMLPESSPDAATSTPSLRKRKFVEVPSDVGDVLSTPDGAYKLEKELSTVVKMPNPLGDPSLFAMTFPSSTPPSLHSDEEQNNVLSIFSPLNALSSSTAHVDAALGGGNPKNAADISTSAPASAVSTPATSVPAVAVTTPIESSLNGSTLAVGHASDLSGGGAVASDSTSITDANNQLAFLDEDLPLLPDSDHYNFTEGEQAVMKKLEDFETSLLDEYDVSCLDTLLQQLKSGGGVKLSGVAVPDSEEVVVGPSHSSPQDA